MFEIRLWDKDGRIAYSDDPALIGQKFGLPHDAAEVLAGRDVPANLEMQTDEVNTPNAAPEELVEVYVPVTAPDGQKLVFEAYYDDDEVRAEQSAVLFGMAPPFLLALGVLQLAQLFQACLPVLDPQRGQVACLARSGGAMP